MSAAGKLLLAFVTLLPLVTSSDGQDKKDTQARERIASIIQQLFHPESNPYLEESDPALILLLSTPVNETDEKRNFEAWEQISASIMNMANADWRLFTEPTRKIIYCRGITPHWIATMFKGIEWHPLSYSNYGNSPYHILRIKFAAANSVEDANVLMYHMEEVQQLRETHPFKAGDESYKGGNFFVTRVGTTVVSVVIDRRCSQDQLEENIHMILGRYY